MSGNLVRTLIRGASRGVVGAGAIALLVISWTAVRANRNLASTNLSLIESRVYPYPLTALRLDTPETKLVRSQEFNAGHKPQRYLVLVSSDPCHFCDQNSASWLDLLQGISPSDRTGVWMIAYGSVGKDEPFERALTEQKITYRLFQVSDSLIFPLRTGLVATPTTLLVDAQMRPELVYSGVMTKATLEIFKRGISGSLNGDAEPFLSQGDTDLVKGIP